MRGRAHGRACRIPPKKKSMHVQRPKLRLVLAPLASRSGERLFARLDKVAETDQHQHSTMCARDVSQPTAGTAVAGPGKTATTPGSPSMQLTESEGARAPRPRARSAAPTWCRAAAGRSRGQAPPRGQRIVPRWPGVTRTQAHARTHTPDRSVGQRWFRAALQPPPPSPPARTGVMPVCRIEIQLSRETSSPDHGWNAPARAGTASMSLS